MEQPTHCWQEVITTQGTGAMGAPEMPREAKSADSERGAREIDLQPVHLTSSGADHQRHEGIDRTGHIRGVSICQWLDERLAVQTDWAPIVQESGAS